MALTYNIRPDNKPQLNDPPDKFNSPSFAFYNDTYAEWDSEETINAIKSSLEIHHNVTLIEANEDAYTQLKNNRPDIVFNYSECSNGISREAQIPAMLDMLRIPYTGSDPLTLTTCLHKARTKEVLSYHNIPNPNFFLADSVSSLSGFALNFPVIVKPLGEGSSKGIFNNSFINNKEELVKSLEEKIKEYDQSFIIEEYLPGREFTIGILGNGQSAEVLPIVEINFDELPESLVPIYSFEAKWVEDTRDNPLNIFTCPANINGKIGAKIKETALAAYNILNCKDWSRIDIRLDKNDIPNIIEVNPLPGAIPDPQDNSCLPKAARANGISYEEMINRVLFFAAKRHNLI